MYNEQIEQLINAALADGVLTEKEKQVLFKKAESMGIDLDEFEMVLSSKLYEKQKAIEEEHKKKSDVAPKSNKMGDVRKCPACGAIVSSYQVKCPECGYEFSEVAANSSTQLLADKLVAAVGNHEKQVQIIETFPIPSTKADLLEFVTSLKPRAFINKKNDREGLSSAYRKKYYECIEKIKVNFSSDSAFVWVLKESEKEKRNRIIKISINWFVKVGIPILLLFWMILGMRSCLNSVDSSYCITNVNRCLKEDNPKKAEEYLFNYSYIDSSPENVNAAFDALIDYYINKDDARNAIRIGDAFGDRYEKWGDHEKISSNWDEKLYNYLMSKGMYKDAARFEPLPRRY